MGDPDGTVIPVSLRVILAKAGIQNKKIMALALATGLLVLMGAGCAIPELSKGLLQNQSVISEDPNITAWKDAKLQKLDEDLYSVAIGGRTLLWSPRKDSIGYVSPFSEIVFQLDKSQGMPVIKGEEIFTHGDARYSFYDKNTFSLIGIISVGGEGQASVGAYVGINAHASCENDVPKKGDAEKGILTYFEVSERSDISKPMKRVSLISYEEIEKIDVKCMRDDYGELYITSINATSTKENSISIFGRPFMDAYSKYLYLPIGKSKLRLDFSSGSDPMIPRVSLEKPEIKTVPERADDL